jgi:hypothetical protein
VTTQGQVGGGLPVAIMTRFALNTAWLSRTRFQELSAELNLTTLALICSMSSDLVSAEISSETYRPKSWRR